jgi:hypothetical protein
LESDVKITLLPLAIALVAASPSSSVETLQQGAADVGAAIKTPLTLSVDPDIASIIVDGERISVSPTTVALVKTREEARALVALAIAYKPKPIRAGRRKPGTAEYVAALPLYLAAQGAFDRQRQSTGSGYPVEWNEPSGSDPEAVRSSIKRAKQSRAAFAVQLVQKAGGCSGPMVDLLNRMRAEDSSSGAASEMTNAGFARVALADLGRSVYPPDRSCE